MDKQALLERLVRLGATDIPNTPRLLMRERGPEELAALQQGVEGAFQRVQEPLKAKATNLLSRVANPKIRGALQSGAHALIENPEMIPMTAVPVPGISAAYLAAKKGLEKGIDRLAPLGGKLVTASAEGPDVATKKNPELWSKAKSEAKAQLGGKWSARAAQLAVQKYKSEGGKYVGKKPSASKNSLAKWTKQDWQTRPGTPEKAERGGVTHRYLPKDKWESLTKKEQLATDKKKVEGDRKGKEIVPNTTAARVKSAAEHLEFQHDPSATEPQPEGGMTLSRLHHLMDMSGDMLRAIHPNDHLPPWVSDHITSAHENLSQVHSYIEPRSHEALQGMPLKSKISSATYAAFVHEVQKIAELERNPVGADKQHAATGGLTAAGRAHFAREEGAHLKPGVKEKNPTGEKAKRKGSFLTRFFTNPRGPMEDEKGRPTRLALSAQAWGEPTPHNREDAARLAAKGRSLLGKSKEAAQFGGFSDELLRFFQE
jgi:hypothetical protein